MGGLVKIKPLIWNCNVNHVMLFTSSRYALATLLLQFSRKKSKASKVGEGQEARPAIDKVSSAVWRIPVPNFKAEVNGVDGPGCGVFDKDDE